ncbi:uncharacterized protein LOC126741016 isoform X2 [Anthonomus grandis grandis]|uniref:uncharacterized protein LOC126741016 isoform X2 n=1 Tax=Anthonomus grandis grandis TaxID=2921223 RepID=UPI0021654CB1|nr:uncharacterized protein LOC126741016 isoform X2 [Anthonomus grandis grandis]
MMQRKTVLMVLLVLLQIAKDSDCGENDWKGLESTNLPKNEPKSITESRGENRTLTGETGNGVENKIVFAEDNDDAPLKLKRGILHKGTNNRQFGGSGYGSSGFGGGYEPSRPGGYPYVPDSHDVRGPPYESDLAYNPTGGGYLGGRPYHYGAGYDHKYGPTYGPPRGPPYEYDEERGPYYHPQANSGEEYHYHQGVDNFKGLALKKLLLPLAGLAILGVAAAAAKNPVLLQLGTINGRKRRSLVIDGVYPSNRYVKPVNRYKKGSCC